MSTRNPLSVSGASPNNTNNIDAIVIPQTLKDAIGDDELLGLYTPPDEANNCLSNLLHCRYNQMFQCPFCCFWPVAALGYIICLPYEVCAGRARWFTKTIKGVCWQSLAAR